MVLNIFLFICWAIWIFSMLKFLFISFAHFLFGLSFYCVPGVLCKILDKFFIEYVFCKYFLLVCCIYFISWWFFWKKSFYIFDKVQFISFSLFWTEFLVSCLRNPCPILYISYYVFYKSFIVLALTFKPILHFELIFQCGVWWGSKLIFFCVDSQMYLHHLLNRVSFLPMNCLGTFFKNQPTINVRVASEQSVLFHWSVCQYPYASVSW